MTTLQTFGPESAALLAALHRASFTDGAEIWDEASFRSLLKTPGTQAIVAHDNTTPAGFILVRTILDETEILTLAVHPAHRRRGIAQSLVRSILTSGTVFLEVSTINTAARDLYLKSGFKEIALRRGYYKDGSDAQLMSFTIS